MGRTIVWTLVIGLFLSSSAVGQRGRIAEAKLNSWINLGSKSVNWKLEKDVLRVGVQEGGFSKLKIKVTGGTVRIKRMVVTYGNGTRDEIALKHNFKRGAASRVIDLEGGKRVIKNISFIYDRKNITRRAKVWVAGRR